MRFLRKVKQEKGSITITVVVAMLFTTSAIIIAYFSLSNQSNDQSKKIRQVADSYNVTNSDLVQKYKDTYDKSPDHTEVSYIQSTGTQYIDTKFKPNSNSKIILKFKTPKPISNNCFLFGSRAEGRKNEFGVFYSTTDLSRGYTGRFGNNSNYFSSVAYTDKNNNIIEIELSSERFYIKSFDQYNNQKIEEYIVSGNIEALYDIYLFSINTENSAKNFSSYLLYSCKIWDDNTLARDFVPALDRKDIPCLYDKVEEKPYYNQGEGEFLYGNE